MLHEWYLSRNQDSDVLDPELVMLDFRYWLDSSFKIPHYDLDSIHCTFKALIVQIFLIPIDGMEMIADDIHAVEIKLKWLKRNFIITVITTTSILPQPLPPPSLAPLPQK